MKKDVHGSEKNATLEEIVLKQNLNEHIEVYLSAAQWQTRNCVVYSTVWYSKIYS